MKKFIVIPALCIFWLVAVQSAAGELKIVYADLQVALNNSVAGLKARMELNKERDARENELKGRQDELKQLKDEFDSKRTIWNEKTRMEKEKEILQMSQELQEQYQAYREDLNRKKIESEGRIIENLKKIVEEIAKREGYDYVLEKSFGGIVYGPPEDDITEMVIEAYDKDYVE